MSVFSSSQQAGSAASSAAAEELLRAVCGYLLGSLAPTLFGDSSQHEVAVTTQLALASLAHPNPDLNLSYL